MDERDNKAMNDELRKDEMTEKEKYIKDLIEEIDKYKTQLSKTKSISDREFKAISIAIFGIKQIIKLIK